MAYHTYSGSFVKSGSAGAQVITPSGLLFSPKAIIFWSSLTTAQDTGTSNGRYLFGLTSGPSGSYSCCSSQQDGVDPGVCAKRFADKAVTIVDHAGTLEAECSLTSFDTFGFTLDWTTNNATGYIIYYLILGGSDLTNVSTILWYLNNSSGSQSVVGAGFQPDALFSINAGELFGSSLPSTKSGSATRSQISLGVATATGQAATSACFGTTTSTGLGTGRWQEIDEFIICVSAGGGNEFRADRTSIDADGFTINIDNAAGSANDVPIATLCLKGGTYTIAEIIKPTGAAPQNQSVNLGLQPGEVLLFGNNYTSDGFLARGSITVGVADTNFQGSAAAFSLDGAVPTDTGRISSSDRAYIKTANGYSTPEAKAEFIQFTATGFDLTWDVNDGSATRIKVFAINSTPPVTYGNRISQYVVEAITQPSAEAGFPLVRLSQYVIEAVTQSGAPVVTPGTPCAPTTSIQQSYPPCYGAEFDTYIAPDGHEYQFNVKGFRYLMTEEGFGIPPINYITSSGPFQHGETLRDWFLQPRIIQLMISNLSNSRQEYTRQRALLLDAIRPNRQVNDNAREPGVLRKRLSDGSIRDLKVIIESGPGFGPRDLARWDEYRFQEILRFIAHDPILFNPTQQCRSFLVGGSSGGSGGGTQLIFPITFPILFGVGTGSSGGSGGGITGTLQYNGTWEEYPTIVIHGPIISPIIENITTGERLTLETSILAGETVTFELTYAVKTVTKDDGTNMLGYISDDSDLATFHLSTINSGLNQITISGSGTNSSTFVEFFYYERFIGR